MQLPPTFDGRWEDRVVRNTGREADDSAECLLAAVAAARIAIEGQVEAPRIEVRAYAPARGAEVAWTLALAALAARRDATALIDHAFELTGQISDRAWRDPMLLWGARALRERGELSLAARWSGAIEEVGCLHELGAQTVRLRAQAGDLAGAREALELLPPIWMYRDERWPWCPAWSGSAAVAACVALASPEVVASPGAHALVLAAEQSSARIDQDWRMNREQRALALAWARLGELDRAFAAAARMPGTERADVLAELLDGFGDGPTVALDRLERLARGAVAAQRGKPLVISEGEVAQETYDLIGDVVAARVIAAIARRHLVRGDFAAARAAITEITPMASVHHEAALQLECARLARGETSLAQVMRTVPESWRSNLVDAASAVGCDAVVERLLTGPLRHRSNHVWSAIQRGQLGRAAILLRPAWRRIDSHDGGRLLASLVVALASAGRSVEAAALWAEFPPLETPYAERLALVGAHRLVVALVEEGAHGAARSLYDGLALRLALVGDDD